MCQGEIVVLSFRLRKPENMSLIAMRGDNGEEMLPDIFFKLLKYSFCSLDKGRVLVSAVPVRRASPKGVKLLGPSISLIGTMVNGVPSGCERCALFRKVSTLSISLGLYRY